MGKLRKQQITKWERWLLFLLFFELFAGGGGRIFSIGSISIRQILFGAILLVFLTRLLLNAQTRKEILQYFTKHNTAVFWVSLLMLFWIIFSSIWGIVQHHGLRMVLTDSFRVIFIVMIIPLIYYVGENRFSKSDFLKVLYFAALFVSLLTIFISVTGKLLNEHQFYYFYKNINSIFPGDLFFRPSRGVFYKSLFLVLFALIAFSVEYMSGKLTKFHAVTMGLSSLAIIFSETRGLYLGFLVGLLTFLLVKAVIHFWGKPLSKITSKQPWFNILFLIIAISGTLYFYENSTIARFSEPDTTLPSENHASPDQKPVNDESVNVRFVLLNDSVKLINKSPLALLVGNGYGTKIGKRTGGIEMTFVDIMVEQGIFGVALWLALSLLPLFYYFRAFLRQGDLPSDDIALLGCSLAMILMTNINPFLNSPIGLGFLLPVVVLAFKSANVVKSQTR